MRVDVVALRDIDMMIAWPLQVGHTNARARTGRSRVQADRRHGWNEREIVAARKRDELDLEILDARVPFAVARAPVCVDSRQRAQHSLALVLFIKTQTHN